MDLEYRQFKLLVFGIAFLLFVGLLAFIYLALQRAGVPQRAEVTVKNVTVYAEPVSSPSARAKGLAGRSYLGELDGMLFLFENPEPQLFWMKGMLMPIDLIWIRSGVVVGMIEYIEPPPSGTPDTALKIYRSPLPVDQVLEVRAGFIQKYGIEAGDSVVVKMP